jgi:hypothetical protein
MKNLLNEPHPWIWGTLAFAMAGGIAAKLFDHHVLHTTFGIIWGYVWVFAFVVMFVWGIVWMVIGVMRLRRAP